MLASSSLEEEDAIGCGVSIFASALDEEDGVIDLGRSVDGVFELHASRRNAAKDFFTTK